MSIQTKWTLMLFLIFHCRLLIFYIFSIFIFHWTFFCRTAWAYRQTQYIKYCEHVLVLLLLLITGRVSCDKIQEAVITLNVNELSTAHRTCLPQNYNINQTLNRVYEKQLFHATQWIFNVPLIIMLHIKSYDTCVCWKKIN